MRLLKSCFFSEFASEGAANGGGLLMSLRSSPAAVLGSFVAMIALTIATPSNFLVEHDDWYRTRWTFPELIPPIDTVRT
jgi:hypothetical protein